MKHVCRSVKRIRQARQCDDKISLSYRSSDERSSPKEKPALNGNGWMMF